MIRSKGLILFMKIAQAAKGLHPGLVLRPSTGVPSQLFSQCLGKPRGSQPLSCRRRENSRALSGIGNTYLRTGRADMPSSLRQTCFQILTPHRRMAARVRKFKHAERTENFDRR